MKFSTKAMIGGVTIAISAIISTPQAFAGVASGGSYGYGSTSGAVGFGDAPNCEKFIPASSVVGCFTVYSGQWGSDESETQAEVKQEHSIETYQAIQNEPGGSGNARINHSRTILIAGSSTCIDMQSPFTAASTLVQYGYNGGKDPQYYCYSWDVWSYVK